jgi:uncharacterized protein YcfL
LGTQTYAVEPSDDIEDIFLETTEVGVDCFDYYKFQSVQVNVGPSKSSFAPGEDIDFNGKIENENKYPVFNGYVYVRIAEKNPSYINEGHNIVDEFIALGPISVDSSSSLPVSFSWKIPENLKSGEYTANYFFSVNKKLNLGGLPFTNEIIVGFADFSVASTKIGNVSFVKSSTKVNGTKYNHIGEWPLISPDGKAVVSQVIQNTLKQDIKTDITYNLYFWDSLDSKDLISTKKESLTIKAGESKTITYEIPKVELSVYYLQIVARNENGTKSIVNMRITSESARPRINYFGLDGFPIQKGATTTLYSCFHNTSNISASGTTVLIAKDKIGNEISRVEYAGIIPSSISAEKTEFIANSKLDYVKLEQKIYDEQNNLLDTQEIIYDISLIKKPEIKAEPINPIIVAVLAGLIIFGFLLFAIRPIRRNKNLCLVISLVIISLAGTLIVLFMQARPVRAQSTVGNFQKSQSGTVVKPFSIGYIGGAYNKILKDANVQYNYTINTTADSAVINVGDEFGFTHSAVGTFNGTGGYSDTPYLGEKMTYPVGTKNGNVSFTSRMEAAKWVPFTETVKRKGRCLGSFKGGSATDCIGGAYGDDGLISATYKATDPNPSDTRYGYRKQADLPQFGGAVSGKLYYPYLGGIPSIYYYDDAFRSDNSVINCSSGTCKAVGPGKAIVKVKINPSQVILGYSYPVPLRLYRETLTEGFRDSIPFEGFTAYWEFNVLSADVVIPKKITPPSSSGCTLNVYDDEPTWEECDEVNNSQKGYYATTTVCTNATNTAPVVTPRCCVDVYSYDFGVCDDTTGYKKRTINKVDCPNATNEEENRQEPCDGYTTDNVSATCVPTQSSSSLIYINKPMQWEMVGNTAIPSNADTKWSDTNISNTVTKVGPVLEKIYTTVGLKNISANSEWVDTDSRTIYTATCSASVNVIQGVGGSREI